MTYQNRHRKLKSELLRASPFLLVLVGVFVVQKWGWLAQRGWVSTRPPPGAADTIAGGFLVYVLAHWVIAAIAIVALLAAVAFLLLRVKLLGQRGRRLLERLDQEELAKQKCRTKRK